jgi:hypothetical protein
MTPDIANFSGNVHGGTLLKLLDQVAYACASRYAGAYVVTVSVDQVVFRQPIHVGELVTFLASVNQLVDGDRHQGARREHPDAEDPSCQQLLLHDGRRGRARRTGDRAPLGAHRAGPAHALRAGLAAPAVAP